MPRIIKLMSISRVLSAQLPDVFCYHLKSTGTQKSFSTIVTCISCHAKTKWNFRINTKTQICFLQKRFIGENDFGSGNVSKPTIRITFLTFMRVLRFWQHKKCNEIIQIGLNLAGKYNFTCGVKQEECQQHG